jgi:copper chaperone CopZ
MTHTYNITGMTCSNCQAKVQQLLSQVAGITKVKVDFLNAEATIEMDKHIATTILKNALKHYPKYQLAETNHAQQPTSPIIEEEP